MSYDEHLYVTQANELEGVQEDTLNEALSMAEVDRSYLLP